VYDSRVLSCKFCEGWVASEGPKAHNYDEVAELEGVTIGGETSSRSAGPTQDRHVPKLEEVRSQLRTILASPAFHGSKRCQQFLEYVCEKSLAGEAGALKERTVAIDVFGRQPQSELGEDTIVRVGAREVRKRLAQFYVSPEGVASSVRIDLPAGSYAPEFHYAVALVEKDPAPETAPAVAEPPRRRRTAIVLTITLVVVLAGLGVAQFTGFGHKPDALTKFWKPVFESNEPLLVGVAHPLVYHPSIRALKLSESRLPPTKIPMQRPLQVSPRELDGSDLIPVPDQYVAYGDMVAVNQITNMLARKSKSVRVRLADNISSDLRQVPVLLIGAITNHWTMEFQQNWRFQFTFQPGYSAVLVDTFDKPAPGVKQRQWSVPATNDDSASEDYVLVCRLRSPSTGGFVMVVSGVKQFGTEAAGRLVSDADQLAKVLHDLPTGWEEKNLQIVLHVRVIGNTPAQPEVAAWQAW
jgi:hypothetical protein